MKDFTWWPLPLFALPAEAVVGFPLWFAPGWANGWPGLRFQAVWSCGMAVILSIMAMTVLVSVGAMLCWLLVKFRPGLRDAGRLYVAWLIASAVAVTVLGLDIFRDLHDGMMKTFPNGYGS